MAPPTFKDGGINERLPTQWDTLWQWEHANFVTRDFNNVGL